MADCEREIPSGSQAGGKSSKGVNLFLARQKLIADMEEAEPETGGVAETQGRSVSHECSACYLTV